MHWFALLTAILANVLANVAFKKAVDNSASTGNTSGFLNLAFQPWMWFGLCMAVVLLGCYLYALRGIDLSVAYPAVTGLAMVGIAIAGALFLGETLSLVKALGVGLIISGVFALYHGT